jgi:predicted dehydrogenase
MLLRIAILEASHWHVPMYLPGLDPTKVNVVAVSDRQNAKGPKIAHQFSANYYQDYNELLAKEDIDFAFAFGRHCDMAAIVTKLVDMNIPFSVEKPAGMNAENLASVQAMVHQKNLFNSVPLIQRYGALFRNLKGLADTWAHMSFRFIAGPLARYELAECSWMLDKDQSAGGCTINLAVHFIDLLHCLTGDEIATVSAQMTTDTSLANVEIFSSLCLRTTSGTICNIETGYTFPGDMTAKREFSFSLASDTHYVRSNLNGMQVAKHGAVAPSNIVFDMETDDYYADYTRNVLTAFENNQLADADLLALKRVMIVIDLAYASASQGGVLLSNTALESA